VISYALWQREFGGQDSAIGSNLVVYGRSVPVIGVTPPRFFGLEVGKQFDVAIPFCSGATTSTGASALLRRDYFWLRALGRLKPGWTPEQASAQLESISLGLFEATAPAGYSSKWMEDFRAFRFAAYPAGNGVSSLRAEYDTSLWLLLSITGLVLLIACANLANLMLVRATAREREMAVRLALGASRWRLIRQLLCEGMVLAVSGAVGGLALAGVFSKGLVRLLATAGEPLNLDLSMDWRMLAFTAMVAVLTCLAFGLLPAFRCSRTPPADSLKSGSRGTTQGRERFSSQRTLVALQISISLVLLVGALLFVRSFWNLMTIDPGLREKDIVVGLVDLRALSLPPEKDEPYVRQLLEKVRAIPQIQSASTATLIPLTGGSWTSGVRVDGAEGQSKFTWVSPGYFETLQIALLAGRDFNERDTRTSTHVAIVNQTFVRKFLEGINPVGRVIRTNPEPDFPETEYEIVGVIKDTKYGGLREETPPMSFAPASQYPPIAPWTNLVLRASSSPESAIPAVRQILMDTNPGIRANFRVFQTEIESGLIRERTMALLSGFFGALAALLAVIGLYGVISYVIAMRKNEIGIRLALGASRGNVIRIIVSQTMQVLGVGIVVGVALSLSVTRGARSLIFGLRPNDPLTIVAASAFLIVVALIASYLPAFRASRISPMKALRYE
jgi:predicted permease